ncbi:MAG: hypothetical protein MUF10_02570 [Thermoanaerobaculaceae bacterium]|jgi:hypothetical protein|nr:hypothetical protein [Thermoanaerobaculaceae bacterium]
MSGPVWRLDSQRSGQCSVCLRTEHGMLVEGEVADNAFSPVRLVCQACFTRWPVLVVSGEMGAHTPSPAYARKP